MYRFVKTILLCELLASCLGQIPQRVVKRQLPFQQVSSDVLSEYPNGAFDDRKPPPDPNNQRYKDYVNELIRFDDWATGHSHVRGPQDVLPDDEFNDPKPQTDPYNQAYKDYVNVLTRFDSWVTGQKVPIPADAVTDALHQDNGSISENDQDDQTFSGLTQDLLPPHSGDLNSVAPTTSVNNDVAFSDSAPTIPANQAYNDYVKVLTRFDSWVTGNKVPIPADTATDVLHQVFRRSVISPETHFGDNFNDRTPVSPASNPAYKSFVQELKRFDPWITGQKVPIPHDAPTDALHKIRR